jgi:hypothetical protein
VQVPRARSPKTCVPADPLPPPASSWVSGEVMSADVAGERPSADWKGEAMAMEGRTRRIEGDRGVYAKKVGSRSKLGVVCKYPLRIFIKSTLNRIAITNRDPNRGVL